MRKKSRIKKFALFIDEINRGNISKIFGELITLIERDKRIGMKDVDGLKVRLPYSEDLFGVPVNVDIIGTMNTADRSLALLDSALRRRFEFKEMMPDPDTIKVKDIKDDEGGDIDLVLLLRKMNERLTHLLHRDQTIGHSYFHKVKNFTDLKRVFAREILPLLQESFYDDWQKIRLILADQNAPENIQLIKKYEKNIEELFPNADSADIGNRERFEIIHEDEITPASIRKIYE